MAPCWCCDRRLSPGPCSCGAGYCLRCGLCPACCECPAPWIVAPGEDDGYLLGGDPPMGHAINDCPHCGMEVLVPAGAAGRHRCPGCGGLVVVAPSGGGATPGVIPLLCPRCGGPRREGQGGCPACGVPHAASPPRYAWRSVALGILLGVLGTLVAYLLTRRP